MHWFVLLMVFGAVSAICYILCREWMEHSWEASQSDFSLNPPCLFG